MRNVRWFALVVTCGLAYAVIIGGRSTSAPAVAQGQTEVKPFTVKIVCGLKDRQPTVWEGSVRATNANVRSVEGWRFLPNEDQITAPNSWRLRTDLNPQPANPPTPANPTTPNGVLVFGSASGGASFDVTTNRGAFSFRLSELKLGQPSEQLNGEVSVELLPATTKLTDDLREDDFPSIAVDSDGTAWAVWQSYSGLRDEVRLRRYANGRWHTFTRLPDVSGDVYRPQVAIDANHNIWIVWAQQVKGNWDLYARAFDGQQWLNEIRLTDAPLPDINHNVVTDASGNLVVVWQEFREIPDGRPQSFIFMRHYDHFANRWSRQVRVSTGKCNDWDPAVAVDSKGNAWIVWDTYENGNYDVRLRQVALPPKGVVADSDEIKIATTPQAEMRATVACDKANRVWVAYEVARPNWGKDQGYTIRQNPFGVPLGGPRNVEVRVVVDGQLKEPAAQTSTAMPPGERQFFFTPHLQVDDAGRVWLNVRHKSTRGVRNPNNPQQVQQRNFWEEWLTRYDGDQWTPAIVMPNSMGRQSILSDVASGQDGTLWLTWTTDNRRYENLHRPIHHEVYAASIEVEGEVKEPVLRDVPPSAPLSPPQPTQSQPEKRLGEHANETADVNAIRHYRVKVGGVVHQIVRGDLHRHTELSWDGGGGNDGSAIDFYRYMIDAAAMDYGAITDHNAGGDYEYWWWFTEKLADLYHVPGAYVPLFAYERSAVFPNGHRNIVHSYRGVPVVSFFTTPTLTGERPGIGTGALLENDTKLLYSELRKSKGIAISHTSATRMGTDWRDNDKQLEPVVEIFQGARTNYEYAGAPKSADPQRDAQHIRQAGYQPEGFVWNAWKRGYRLGVITASDHGSTHMSYAMVYTQTPTREGILNAIRKRHTYGATDNIILEFRIGNGFMGDEITVTEPPTLWVKVKGTNELSRVDIVRNNEFIYNTDPKGRNTTFTFRDNKAVKSVSYYYVRVQQEDGQMAWSSPIWVTVK